MSAFSDLRADPEYGALRRVSARIGADPTQIQGAGGNTSLKRGGAMLVKASGTWLAEAETRDIMVPVESERLAEALDRIEEDGVAAFVPAGENPSGLRPSIETTVHAVMPWPVVIHSHSVAAIAVAIRAEAEALVAERLAGLDPVFVPYAQPGLSLARAIAARIGPLSRLVVLGNHGLIAAGPSVAEADALLVEASAHLDAPVLPVPGGGGDHRPLPRESGYLPVPEADLLALDPRLCALAAAGSYYPDHVVFLGPAVAVAEDPAAAGGAPLVLLPGRGAVLRADLGPAARAMVGCLAAVLSRVPEGAALRALDPEEEGALLDWDAEKYRQALERRRAP